MRGITKLIILFVIACLSSILIYYMTVPEEKRIPFGIQINI